MKLDVNGVTGKEGSFDHLRPSTACGNRGLYWHVPTSIMIRPTMPHAILQRCASAVI